MERSEFNYELEKAFNSWKAGTGAEADLTALELAIQFAYKNGIDLVLKMDWGKVMGIREGHIDGRPITSEDAIRFPTGVEDGFVLFDIPAEANCEHVKRNKRYTLKAENLHDHASLLIKSPEVGVFGVFYPGEAIELQIK